MLSSWLFLFMSTKHEAILSRSRAKLSAAKDAIARKVQGISVQDTSASACIHRGQPVGRLTCNCSYQPRVHECMTSANGGNLCIRESIDDALDARVLFDDHTHSDVTFLPWVSRDDSRQPIGPVLRMPVCSLCPHRKPPEIMKGSSVRYITERQLVADTITHLVPQAPPNARRVIALARSGLIPATIIATRLNLPLYSVGSRGVVVDLGGGTRVDSSAIAEGPSLLVDDSTHSGSAMAIASHFVGSDTIRAAVYVSSPEYTDFHAVVLPEPHLFSWQIFNSGGVNGAIFDPLLSNGIAFDMDGVICEDPSMDNLVNFEAFLKWVPQAKPKLVPRLTQVPAIITFRLEAWRKHTVEWLALWGVRYRQLVMYPNARPFRLPTREEVVDHKGKTFKESPCRVMFESSPEQAAIIHDASGKIVICHDTEQVWA